MISTNTVQPVTDDRERRTKTLTTNPNGDVGAGRHVAAPREFDFKPRTYKNIVPRETRKVKGPVTTSNFEDLIKAHHIVPVASAKTPAPAPKRRVTRKPKAEK